MAKVDLFPDFKDFLKLLNLERVRYIVIGGYAVIHYGYERATGDLDVWIDVSAANAEKVSKVMQAFAGFAPEMVKPSMFLERGKIFMFGREPGRIDLLTAPAALDFDSCFSRCIAVKWDGIKVPLIALDDLRLNKRAAGRDKDKADLLNLPTGSDLKPEFPKPLRRQKKRRR